MDAMEVLQTRVLMFRLDEETFFTRSLLLLVVLLEGGLLMLLSLKTSYYKWKENWKGLSGKDSQWTLESICVSQQ